MTEVAQPKLFTRCVSERGNLHPDYICDVLFSPSIDDPLMNKEKRMFDKVNALGGRRDEGLRRTPDVVEDVENIWEEGERDQEEKVAGNHGNTHARDSRLYVAPTSSSSVGNTVQGSDLDLFVENEFQFLDSDDEGEGEGRRSAAEVPLLGTLTNLETDQSPSPPSPQPSLTDLSAPDTYESIEDALSSGLEEPVVTSRSSLRQESLDVDEVPVPDHELPPIPAPPPLPPAGVLLAMNAKSATEHPGAGDGPRTSHQSEAVNGLETTNHGAGNVPANTRPKDRPKNEPQVPQNVLFMELQGILNRRLRMIDEDSSIVAPAATVAAPAAAVPIKRTQESLNHQKPSDLRPPEPTVDTDHQLNSFLSEAPSRKEQSDVAEKINSAIPHGSETHIEDSSRLTLGGSNKNLRDLTPVDPPEIENFVYVLPDVSDGGAADMREEFISRGKELDSRGTVALTSQAALVPGQVEDLDEARTKQTMDEIPDYETVRTLIADVDPGHEHSQPGMEAVALPPLTSPASLPDVVAVSKPQSGSVWSGDHLISSPNHSEIDPVVKRTDKVTRPRPSSSSTAVYSWETPSGDEWIPQMDLMDNELEDDFPPQEMLSRRHHQKRPDPAGNQRKQKRTPSKLYQKKQLGGPQRHAPNPGAFSLARINRAVKKVFGSISSKPSSKQRSPISDSVFLQEDGWEIYPSRPYDQSNPGEAVKVVGVEKRPAYAYNAITRQLVILPDHDRVLVTDDGRRIRDQDQQRSNGKPTRPSSPGRNTSVSSREKSRYTSKPKASSPNPPNLNTMTVKSIHMQRRRESVEDEQTADDWRRNSTPNFAGAAAAAVSSSDLSKRKTSTLSKILSFKKASGKTTGNGKKGTDERMTASDKELLKRGGQATRHVNHRPV